MKIKKISKHYSPSNVVVEDLNAKEDNYTTTAKIIKDYTESRHSTIMLRRKTDLVWTGQNTINNQFPMDTLYSQYGNGFKKVGNTVVVQKGVKNVTVTARIQTSNTNYSANAAHYMFTFIRKNGTPICQGIYYMEPWGSDTIETTFPVVEGDVIDVSVRTDYSGSITFSAWPSYGSDAGISYLLVESADY